MSLQRKLDDHDANMALARALWLDEWQRSYHEDPPNGAWEQLPPRRLDDLLHVVSVVRRGGWTFAPDPVLRQMTDLMNRARDRYRGRDED